MNSKLKLLISFFLYYTGLLYLIFRYNLSKKNIRAINYHCTPEIDNKNFEKHLKFYKKYFININFIQLENFLNNSSFLLNTSGIIISFDDGLRSNFDFALPLLNKYNFSGWFFIPSGIFEDNTINFAIKNNINTKQFYKHRYFINKHELSIMSEKHIIGSHTYNHHRFKNSDNIEILNKEIYFSKYIIENELKGKNVPIFCWVGGEIQHYTESAYNYIKYCKYKYSFTTNNLLINKTNNKYNLNRTNIESNFPIPLVMFQISGILDIFYFTKRKKLKNIFK